MRFFFADVRAEEGGVRASFMMVNDGVVAFYFEFILACEAFCIRNTKERCVTDVSASYANYHRGDKGRNRTK